MVRRGVSECSDDVAEGRSEMVGNIPPRRGCDENVTSEPLLEYTWPNIYDKKINWCLGTLTVAKEGIDSLFGAAAKKGNDQCQKSAFSA